MASTKAKLELSVFSISDMIQRLYAFEDNIEVASEDIVAEMVEIGEQLAVEYDAYAPNTGNNNYTFESDSDGKRGYISMVGPDSVYVEFGTGDVGLNEPHPLHNETSGINPYNSGPTIKLDHFDRHYWVYPPMANASQYYLDGGITHGIPAGCQMYNTSVDLKNTAPDVIKKHLSQAVRRL